MRVLFRDQLIEQMKVNKDIYLLLGGVGYAFFEPDGERIINLEASEQAMVDIAVGLALSGKIPFVYAITPHLLRAFEGIRIYLNHEEVPVKLVGIGRDKEYSTLGFTHWAEDTKSIFSSMNNICLHLDSNEFDLNHIIDNKKPEFITLSR